MAEDLPRLVRLHVDAVGILRLEMAPARALMSRAGQDLALHFQLVAFRHDTLRRARGNIGSAGHQIWFVRLGIDIGTTAKLFCSMRNMAAEARSRPSIGSALSPAS